MSTRLFLFRELLGAIRTRSGALFVLAGVLMFLFLGSGACLFLIAPGSAAESADSQPIEEIRVFLSPRLSSATIDRWFLEWRERPEIARLRFQFAQEYDDTASGGVFVVTPADAGTAAALAEEMRQVDGVTEVVEVRREAVLEVPSGLLALRISLLVILVTALAACLFCSRRGYGELLAGFSGEIRMLRLSGTSEGLLSVLVIALGVFIGLLSGLLLFAILYVLHLVALSHPSAFSLFGGLSSMLRILGVGLIAVALGTAVGGLAGLLGASLLRGREFDPLP